MYMIMRAVQILALLYFCGAAPMITHGILLAMVRHSGLGKFCRNDRCGVSGRKSASEQRRGDKRTDHGGK